MHDEEKRSKRLVQEWDDAPKENFLLVDPNTYLRAKVKKTVSATGGEFEAEYLSPGKKNYVASLQSDLLPLKTLAYGVPMHCFVDYFNMSNTFAAK